MYEANPGELVFRSSLRGFKYRQSITVMFLLVALLRMLRPKTLHIHVQLVIRTLTSPMGINLRNRSALVLELETKESFVSLITKLNNKPMFVFTLMSPIIPLYTTRHYFSRTYGTIWDKNIVPQFKNKHVHANLRGCFMRKLAPARVSYRDDFLIWYRVYMMTWSFHISLFESTLHVDKIYV